jgi:hypothetical protein
MVPATAFPGPDLAVAGSDLRAGTILRDVPRAISIEHW